MPELPEVQTIINGLQNKVVNKNITKIIEHRPGTVFWNKKEGNLGEIVSISRRGKYIIIQTTNKCKILIHLRMTGKLIFETNLKKVSSHCRAEIIFEDETKLLFDDVRTFGKIEIFSLDDYIPALEKLGSEPLSKDFNYKYLNKKLIKRKAPIKNILLDQKIVAGLGNIYVAEILYHSKIDPRKPANKLTIDQFKNVVIQVRSVLSDALKYNGTTISDYRNVDDKTGEFQQFLKVYGKKTCECGSMINKIKQAGRSTYFCPECQR